MAGPQPKLRLVIECDAGLNQFSIQGPGNRAVCYAMLEMAKETIHRNGDKNAQQQASKIVVPQLMIGNGPKSM